MSWTHWTPLQTRHLQNNNVPMPLASSTAWAARGAPGSEATVGKVMSRRPRPSSPLNTFNWLLLRREGVHCMAKKWATWDSNEGQRCKQCTDSAKKTWVFTAIAGTSNTTKQVQRTCNYHWQSVCHLASSTLRICRKWCHSWRDNTTWGADGRAGKWFSRACSPCSRPRFSLWGSRATQESVRLSNIYEV